MRIVLVRHGQPDVPDPGKIRAGQLGAWIETYHVSGLAPGQLPPQATRKVAARCTRVLCSDLPRSVQSAWALGVASIHERNPLFREVGLPYAFVPLLQLPVPDGMVSWLWQALRTGVPGAKARRGRSSGADWGRSML